MKNFFKLFALMLTAFLICGCLAEEKVVTADMRGGKIKEPVSSKGREADSEVDDALKVETPARDSIDEILNSMTLEEKIGQMILVGFYGTELNDEIRTALNNFKFGGVILFDRNMESVAQTKKLVDDIQAVANQKVPLFVALDEEGGRVARGKNFLEPAPSQEEIGYGQPADATHWAKYNVKLLRSVGVNINFAPVADVGSRDTRSFGNDAQLVAEFVDAAAQGYESENFLYTLKHFPGIGKSKVDPHQEVSNVEVGRAVLDAEDLPPFTKIIRGHDNSRFMVMIGHLIYDALDPYTSASLSPIIMTDLLRNELGFTGVVITDDLEMGAIKNNVDLATLGVKMILAGGDIALICHNYDSQQIVYDSILAAVKRGEISESRIDESVRRILQLKAHL